MAVQVDVGHPVVLRRGEGESLSDEREYLIKAALPELSLLESAVPAGEAVGPHVHERHADSFYVLEGELDFHVADETVRLPAGSFVVAPPGVVHGFAVVSPAGARWLNLHAPDGGFVESRRARRDDREPRVPLDTAKPPPGGGRPASDATVRLPGEGEELPNERALLKVARPELTLLEYEIEPRSTTSRPRFDHYEACYVLDGEVEFVLDETVVHAEAGTFVLIPPQSDHSWTNAGTRAARFLNVHTPGITPHAG